MTIIFATRRPIVLPLRFVSGVVGVVAIALLIFALVMQPPFDEFRAMTIFLSATALVSLVIGFTLYQTGWIRRSPTIQWTLVSSYIISGVLTFFNVWVTARLMFLNRHDLTLATILLIFASGIAMALGYFLSATLTDQISALNHGARQIARGRLRTRVQVDGRDELAQLAKSFNQMAAQLEGAAQKQQQLESLRRDLIAWVGHDLRTPLASVRAIVEALADQVVEDPATVDRYLRTAKRDISQLSTLIDDLFEMAQIDAGGLKLDRQPNSLTDLLSDSLESFAQQANSKGVRLDGAVERGLDPVYCDARQITRVITNLISNALRHTPSGGKIHVQAATIGDIVTVSVTDTGEGIRDEDVVHIFERFYRGEKSRSRATGGSGLGLAIAKGIVEAHGGEIDILSTAGEGTTVSFTLPRLHSRVRTNPLMRRQRLWAGVRAS